MQNRHYFAATELHWAVADTIIEAIIALDALHTAEQKRYIYGASMQVWTVPHSIDTSYQISGYQPVGVGAVCVLHIVNGDIIVDYT